MGTRVRPVDRGTARAVRQIADLGRELREARMDRGLSSREVAGAVGCLHSEILRVERARVLNVSLLLLNKIAAVVGLDLSARLFPGASPVRDAVHGVLLEDLHGVIHPSLGWGNEVPLPNVGDQRAWDALIRGRD
jgi:transcriptional regulator with XRE-family HTH domain